MVTTFKFMSPWIHVSLIYPQSQLSHVLRTCVFVRFTVYSEPHCGQSFGSCFGLNGSLLSRFGICVISDYYVILFRIKSIGRKVVSGSFIIPAILR